MATKKQKREKALAKREKFLAEVRLSGLEAQQEGLEERRVREGESIMAALRRDISPEVRESLEKELSDLRYNTP